MPDAYKEFELIINSSIENFGNWLISASQDLFDWLFFKDEYDWATLHSLDFHSPDGEF